MTAPFQLSDYGMTTHLCPFLDTHTTSQRQWITKSMRETRLLYFAPSHSRVLYILLPKDGYTRGCW